MEGYYRELAQVRHDVTQLLSTAGFDVDERLQSIQTERETAMGTLTRYRAQRTLESASKQQQINRMSVPEATYHMSGVIGTLADSPMEKAQLTSQFESQFAQLKGQADTARALTHQA